MDKLINPNDVILAPGYRGYVNQVPKLKMGLLKDYNFIPTTVVDGKVVVTLTAADTTTDYPYGYVVDVIRPLSQRTALTVKSIPVGIRRSAQVSDYAKATLFTREHNPDIPASERNTTDYVVYPRPNASIVSGKVDFVFRDLANSVQADNLDEYRLSMSAGISAAGQIRPIWDITDRKDGQGNPVFGDVFFRGMGIIDTATPFNYTLSHVCFQGTINPNTNSAPIAQENLTGSGWGKLVRTHLHAKKKLFGYTHLVTNPHHNTLLFRYRGTDVEAAVTPPPAHFQHFVDSTPQDLKSNVTTSLPPPITGEQCLMTYDEKRDRYYRLEMDGSVGSLAILNKDGYVSRIPVISHSNFTPYQQKPQLFMFDEDWLYIDKGYVEGEDKPYFLHMDTFEVDFETGDLSFFSTVSGMGPCAFATNEETGELYCFVATSGGGVYVLDRDQKKWTLKFSSSHPLAKIVHFFYIGNGEFLIHVESSSTPRFRIMKYRSGPNNMAMNPDPFLNPTAEVLPLFHPELMERGLIYIYKDNPGTQTLGLRYYDFDTKALTSRGLLTSPNIVNYTRIQFGKPFYRGQVSDRYQLGAFFLQGQPEGGRTIREYLFSIDTRELMDFSSSNIQSNFQLVDPTRLDYNDIGNVSSSQKNLYRPKDEIGHLGASYSGLFTLAPENALDRSREVRYILTPNGVTSLRLFSERSGNDAMIRLPPLVEFGSTIIHRQGRIRILGWNGRGYSLWESSVCISPDTNEFDSHPSWSEIVLDVAGIDWVRGSPPAMVEVDGIIIVLYLEKVQGESRLKTMYLDPGIAAFRFATIINEPTDQKVSIGATLVVNTEGRNEIFFLSTNSTSTTLNSLITTNTDWTNVRFYYYDVLGTDKATATLIKNNYYGIIIAGGSNGMWGTYNTVPLAESTYQDRKSSGVTPGPIYSILKDQLGFTCGSDVALSTNTEWLWAGIVSDEQDPSVLVMQVRGRRRVREVPSGLNSAVFPWNNKLIGQSDIDTEKYFNLYDPNSDKFSFHPSPTDRPLRSRLYLLGDEAIISDGFITQDNTYPAYRIDKTDLSLIPIEITRSNHEYFSDFQIYGSEYYWKTCNYKVSAIHSGGSGNSQLGCMIYDSLDKYHYQAYEGAIQTSTPIRYNGNDLYLYDRDLYTHTGLIFTRPNNWRVSGDQHQGTIRYFDSNTGKGFDVVITQRTEGSRLTLIDTDPMRSGTVHAPSVLVREKLYPGTKIYHGFTCRFNIEQVRENTLYLVTEEGLFREGDNSTQVASSTAQMTLLLGQETERWPGIGTAVGDGYVYCLSKFTDNADDIYLWTFDGRTFNRAKLTVNIASRYVAPQTFGPQDYAGFVKDNVLYAWIDNHLYATDLVNMTITGYI